MCIRESIIDVLEEKSLPSYPKSSNYLNNINNVNKIKVNPDILVEKRNDVWYIELFFRKIQPKQKIFSRDVVYLVIKGKAVLNYKIYADNLSEPIIDSLNIEHDIIIKDMSYKDVLMYDEMKYV
jgi:hypothetical protein